MNRTKLLFVYRGLEQAGSQRWIYEICKRIDKDKFEAGVLCDKKYLNAGNEYTYENYYYLKLKETNITLYPYIGYESQQLWERGVRKISRIAHKTLQKDWVKINNKVVCLFNKFDVLCIVDFLGYKAVKNEVYASKNRNFFVVLHSHKFQFKSNHYRHFDKNNSYNFTYFCPKQILEANESGFETDKNKFFYNPLVLDLSNYPNLFNPLTENPIVISIFTRISKMKPIDVFITAFAKLQKKLNRKSILNVYGTIQDEEYYQELQKLIDSLELGKETICFKGHTENIAEAIRKDKINVYWGMSINASVGYASIEVAAMGVPSIFWNYDEQTDSNYVAEQTGGTIIADNKIDDFVNSNLTYLSETKLLAELSLKQRQFFLENHNIVERIKDFENYVKLLQTKAVSDLSLNKFAGAIYTP